MGEVGYTYSTDFSPCQTVLVEQEYVVTGGFIHFLS